MKKKINIRFIMIAALAIVVTALSAMLVYYNILKEQVFGDLKAYAHVIELLNIDDLAAGIEKDPYNPIDDDLRITLIGTDGEVLYESLLNKDEMDNHNERPEIIEAREKGEGEAVRYSATSGTHTFYYAERLQNGNVLRIGRDSVSVNRIMVNTLVIVLVIALGILFVCMGISHYLTKKLVEPIEKLATNIMLVDENNVYEEIRPFVNTIKEQHVNIINNAQLRQEFTATVSHELKTPLTSMKVLADSINSMPDAPKELYQEFMEDITNEIERETKIINDLLSLVKMDKSAAGLNVSSVNINELLEQILKRLQPIADKQKVELVLESFRPVTAEVDEVKITLAITNLVENAIKYNRNDGEGWVHVSLNADHQYFYLKVEDSGIGIPEESLDHIYERFYRVDKSHSREIGGTGLGLAITRNSILMHRGAIKVHSVMGEGTTFDVRIPLNYIA